MKNVFDAENWLCDIAHSIVCDIGGSISDGSANQLQSLMSNSTGNKTIQSVNGPVNSGQIQNALNAGERTYNFLGPAGDSSAAQGIANIQGGANAGIGLQNTGNQTLGNTLNGSYLSANNPYFSNMVSQLGQAVRPQIDGAFESAGRYGSGARDNAFASALTNQAGQLAYQNYGAERANQMGALNNLPSYVSGLTVPGQAQIAAGATPLNNYTQMLSMLKPGTAGSVGEASNSNTSGTGNINGAQSQSGIKASAK